MKKRTISKLKSLFSSKKGKRQQGYSSKSSRSPSPEPVRAASPAPGHDESFRPIQRTPPPSRCGPPPSPPVPTHPVAPVAPEPAAPLPLMPCQVCGRTFVPQSLAKHVKICEKMTIKKRKTFDSSRQRREGTDLEQYLPKNFGLPENSPFLEKSPPPTAKPTPKPKVQATSTRATVTKASKSTAELQRCPHCNRAFGMRAFERHVEWCADKAKILPAAPAQPAHVTDAKQRLHARTQYKAPPVRGRRTSQTRDKSSHSRSASVDSSRGLSPPPREYGDYKQGRNRASESTSSNDCHEEASPHVPVIRNTRTMPNNSSGDANVRARQARLARDLSSSRKKQDPIPSCVQQSHTDPNIKKNVALNKLKNNLSLKKQEQLRKLEILASKYSERMNDKKESMKKALDKRKIPVLRKQDVKTSENVNRNVDTNHETENNVNRNIKTKQAIKSRNQKADKSKSNHSKVLFEEPIAIKKNVSEKKSRKKTTMNTIVKENSMSIDSLENCVLTPKGPNTDRSSQSIGINTELLCVPCVIPDTDESSDKNVTKKNRISPKNLKSHMDEFNHMSEPKLELIYKNPTISLSIQESSSYVKIGFDNSVATLNTDNFMSDEMDSRVNSNADIGDNSFNKIIKEIENSIHSSRVSDKNEVEQLNSELRNQVGEEMHSLSEEHFEENYELDMSAELSNDSIDDKYDDDDNANENLNIECRHGSGETYTKFTEDPADLQEFMNLTDKLITDQNGTESNMDKDLNSFHTPRTDSLEAINEKTAAEPPVHHFSDTFEELKSDLNELLRNSRNAESVTQKPETSLKNIMLDENGREVDDMEHITVYKLKFYEQTPVAVSTEEDASPQFRLPSITDTKAPGTRIECAKKKTQNIYKSNRKFKMLGEQTRKNSEYQTFIVKPTVNDSDDGQSSSDAPPLKLPRLDLKRLDDNYDPFVSAARQMKELMSSDTNIPKKAQNSTKDHSRTLPALQPAKEKGTSTYLRSDNTKMIKDTLNKTYQKTPTLQRMKSFGSTNNDNTSNTNTFGGRCSSFRLNRNEKKPTPKLNTTFTKSSKENISTTDKNYFNRNNSLNRSFSSYTASSYSTPKPKEKIPKIATSMYHSFQRTTIKQPLKLDKIKRDDEKKDFVNLDAILADDNSSMTDSNYIDPRLINENDNLPINVNTILNNPDIISSMESLLTTENLPAKFESFSAVNQNNNKLFSNNHTDFNHKLNKNEPNNNKTNLIVDDLSIQYDKIMHSLEQSIASKTSIRDDDSLCEDFDLEEFMTSFDEEIHKHKSETKRTCSSTTRIVKQSELLDSNRTSERNSVSSTPKIVKSMTPVNKSMSLTFSNNNVVNENLFPSSVKRSTSLLDSIQKKNTLKMDSGRSRHKSDQLEQDIMQSLKDFDKFYESEKNENVFTKEVTKYNGTTKRAKTEKKTRKSNENLANGNHTPNGKASNDSAYSSLNRISPSKLSICTNKESNGLTSLDQIPAGSDSSGSHKDDVRSVSSEEFLAMERSTQRDEPIPPPPDHYKDENNHNEKRASSRASSRRGGSWRAAGAGGAAGALSSSGSEASLAGARRASRFCHECGSKFPVDSAKFCIECGVRRLLV